MPKEDWGFLNEKAFEAALQASVPERLPDKVAAAVTPRKQAMGRVLAGTAPPFHGTAAIQLWPVYQSDELWSAAGEVAGRVLYDRGGETFWAPYHSLEEDTSPYGYQGIYGQRDIFGTFSLSTAAQHGRGYVAYAADEIPHAEYRNVLDSRFHYSYPYRFLQYPAKTALENRMSDHGAFRTVWSDLRYGPEVTPPVIKKNEQRNDPPAKAGGSF